jgi:hypothetical protein
LSIQFFLEACFVFANTYSQCKVFILYVYSQMPVAKKVAKVSAVHVETKKMDDDCCSSKSCAPSLCGGKCKIGHLLII